MRIASISDLRSKVVAMGLPESGTPQLVAALLSHYEMGEEVQSLRRGAVA